MRTKNDSIYREITNILTKKERFLLSAFLNFFFLLPKIEAFSFVSYFSAISISNRLLISSYSAKVDSNRKFSHLVYKFFAVFSGISKNADKIIYLVTIVLANKTVRIRAKKTIEHIDIIRIFVLTLLSD